MESKVDKKIYLAPDPDILNKFKNGHSLSQQYEIADITRKAYIAKNWDMLTKMLTNHKRIMRQIMRLRGVTGQF